MPGRDRATGPGSHDHNPAAPGTPPQSPDPDAARTPPTAAVRRPTCYATVLPGLMAGAIGQDILFGIRAYKVFLERLFVDAGNPPTRSSGCSWGSSRWPHFRIGQLHVKAGLAEGIEEVKVYNSVAARMLGEFRRTAPACASRPASRRARPRRR